jgi:glycosyltransferase involved in cell wall biosynthesis
VDSEKRSVLILMAGPKFDLEWEFGVRLRGLSKFSVGYLITSSWSQAPLRVGDYEVITTRYPLESFVSRFCARVAYVWQCVRTMRSASRSARPVQLVITYDPLLTGVIGWALAATYGAKFVCEVNGDYAADANFMHVRSHAARALKKWAAGRVTRFVLRRATGIRILFPTQLESVRYEARSDQVVVQMPEFVNTPAFSNLGEEPTVLLVGFPFYVKGVDVAIAAFKRITDRFPEWTLKVIGYYPDTRELEEAIGGCARIIHQVPVHHRQMNEHIGRCGILLQSSRTEAMGRVLVEAMAAAKPRVASNVGGIPTVVSDGTDGMLVESGDVDGFAAALSKLMSSPELRQRMGAAGKLRASREFAPEAYFHAVERFLDAVSDQQAASSARP